MSPLQEQDVIKLKELLQYTSEFIAYFELAETKMMAWRQDIEQQGQTQHKLIQQQIQNLHHELESLIDVLTPVGVDRFRMRAEQSLKQGETHLNVLQNTAKTIMTQLKDQHQVLQHAIAKNVEQINQHTQQSLIQIDRYLAGFDVHHFRREASESSLHIEKIANSAVLKSTQLLRLFQWRAIAVVIITAALTAVGIGLYVNNEMPWEIHQHVVNEREAGKVLLRAWPGLTPQEKNKILDMHAKNNAS
jgi:HD-GYP domain-containing protein (c-di-GMP phosphodiesterase class II)